MTFEQATLAARLKIGECCAHHNASLPNALAMVYEWFTPYGYMPCVIAVVAINHTALLNCANDVGSLREFIYVFWIAYLFWK